MRSATLLHVNVKNRTSITRNSQDKILKDDTIGLDAILKF